MSVTTHTRNILMMGFGPGGSTGSSLMRGEFRFAHPSESAEDVAQTISEYTLLALPVIDDKGDIAGIVTVDDAMEILLPKNLQRRLSRLFG